MDILRGEGLSSCAIFLERRARRASLTLLCYIPITWYEPARQIRQSRSGRQNAQSLRVLQFLPELQHLRPSRLVRRHLQIQDHPQARRPGERLIRLASRQTERRRQTLLRAFISLLRKFARDRTTGVAPVHRKVTAIHGVHDAIFKKFAHSHDAGVCQVHFLVSVFFRQRQDLRCIII